LLRGTLIRVRPGLDGAFFCRSAFKSKVGDLNNIADTMLAEFLGDDDTDLDIFSPIGNLVRPDILYRPGRKRLI